MDLVGLVGGCAFRGLRVLGRIGWGRSGNVFSGFEVQVEEHIDFLKLQGIGHSVAVPYRMLYTMIHAPTQQKRKGTPTMGI